MYTEPWRTLTLAALDGGWSTFAKANTKACMGNQASGHTGQEVQQGCSEGGGVHLDESLELWEQAEEAEYLECGYRWG